MSVTLQAVVSFWSQHGWMASCSCSVEVVTVSRVCMLRHMQDICSLDLWVQ